jgi:hypothetical protein
MDPIFAVTDLSIDAAPDDIQHGICQLAKCDGYLALSGRLSQPGDSLFQRAKVIRQPVALGAQLDRRRSSVQNAGDEDARISGHNGAGRAARATLDEYDVPSRFRRHAKVDMERTLHEPYPFLATRPLHYPLRGFGPPGVHDHNEVAPTHSWERMSII